MKTTSFLRTLILIVASENLFTKGGTCNLQCSQTICERQRICPREAPYFCVEGTAAGTCATLADDFADAIDCDSCCSLDRCKEDFVDPSSNINGSSYPRDVEGRHILSDSTTGALCAVGAFALLACCCMTYVGRRSYTYSKLSEESQPLHKNKEDSWCCGSTRNEEPGSLILQKSFGLSGVKWEGYSLTLLDEYTTDRRDPSAVYACVKRGAESAKWMFEKHGKGYLIYLEDGGRDVDRPSYLTVEDGSDENFGRDVRDAKSLYVIGTAEVARAGHWERVFTKDDPSGFYIKLVGVSNQAAKKRVGYYLSVLDAKSMDRRDSTSAHAMVHKDIAKASMWKTSTRDL